MPLKSLPHQMLGTCYPETSTVTRWVSWDTTDVVDTEHNKDGNTTRMDLDFLNHALSHLKHVFAYKNHMRPLTWMG